MSKPPAAIEMKCGMCISQVAVEEGLIALGNALAEVSATHKIWTFASVPRRCFWDASHVLEPFGIPLRVLDTLEEDEWTLTSIGVRKADYLGERIEIEIVKREIWSPGI